MFLWIKANFLSHCRIKKSHSIKSLCWRKRKKKSPIGFSRCTCETAFLGMLGFLSISIFLMKKPHFTFAFISSIFLFNDLIDVSMHLFCLYQEINSFGTDNAKSEISCKSPSINCYNSCWIQCFANHLEHDVFIYFLYSSWVVWSNQVRWLAFGIPIVQMLFWDWWMMVFFDDVQICSKLLASEFSTCKESERGDCAKLLKSFWRPSPERRGKAILWSTGMLNFLFQDYVHAYEKFGDYFSYINLLSSFSAEIWIVFSCLYYPSFSVDDILFNFTGWKCVLNICQLYFFFWD